MISYLLNINFNRSQSVLHNNRAVSQWIVDLKVISTWGIPYYCPWNRISSFSLCHFVAHVQWFGLKRTASRLGTYFSWDCVHNKGRLQLQLNHNEPDWLSGYHIRTVKRQTSLFHKLMCACDVSVIENGNVFNCHWQSIHRIFHPFGLCCVIIAPFMHPEWLLSISFNSLHNRFAISWLHGAWE